MRDRALFDLAIDSKLRGCDVVRVRIGDLVSGGRVRDRAIVVQQKTKRPVQFELLDTARKTIRVWLERRGGTLNNFVFPSRNSYMAHMGTRQYARLIREWVIGIGRPPQDYGTHSLRRTKASITYKSPGNLHAVQILLGHAKIDSTIRYLGVDVEDASELAERTEVERDPLPDVRAAFPFPNSRHSFLPMSFRTLTATSLSETLRDIDHKMLLTLSKHACDQTRIAATKAWKAAVGWRRLG